MSRKKDKFQDATYAWRHCICNNHCDVIALSSPLQCNNCGVIALSPSLQYWVVFVWLSVIFWITMALFVFNWTKRGYIMAVLSLVLLVLAAQHREYFLWWVSVYSNTAPIKCAVHYRALATLDCLSCIYMYM